MQEKREAREKLLNIIRTAIKQDADLRTELQIGDKFRFVRDKLNALLLNMEEELKALKEQTEQPEVVSSADDVNVFVYLFNAQGLDVQTWRKMIGPKVFYEYSVNRPIYSSQEEIEKFIASKPTQPQHAYLAVSIKKAAIIASPEQTKDALGNPLIKVKEGALSITRVITFRHNKIDYQVSEEGVLTKKS